MCIATIFLEFVIPLDFHNIQIFWAISAILIPIYNIYWYETSKDMTMAEISGQFLGMLMLEFFLFGMMLNFMAYGGLWTFPIVFETLMCFNPYFASGYIWFKYQFSYNYWRIWADANPTKGL